MAADFKQVMTLRDSPHVYFHLSQHTLSLSDQPLLDELTTRSYLTAALQQYLGLTGLAVPLDILKVHGHHTWIRAPRQDEMALTAALSQWVSSSGVSFRVEARGAWLGGVVARSGGQRNLWTLAT